MPPHVTCWCGRCETCQARVRSQRFRARKRTLPSRPSCIRYGRKTWLGVSLPPGPEDMEQLIIGPPWHEE
jgi:hypothetical protein